MSCKALGIRESTYHYKSTAKTSKKEKDSWLVQQIEEIEKLLPQSGYRTVRSILARDAPINHKRIQRVMRENSLTIRRKAAYKPSTTDSKHSFRKYPNLVKGKVTTNINEIVVGDITAYDILGVDHYVASLIDIHSRKTIGIAISDRINTDLVMSALYSAKQTRGSLAGCIHHTDSDSRYCSDVYTKALKEFDMRISMCVGSAYQNAFAEIFNKTLKTQEINVTPYESKLHSFSSILSYIKKYNDYRPHSGLNGMSPNMFEEELKKKEKK